MRQVMDRYSLKLLFCFSFFLLAGCFELAGTSAEDPSAAEPTGTSPSAANNAPVISGNPPASITVGSSYSFQPAAMDPDNDNLTFSIANQPRWIEFDSATGRISGTPLQGDEAAYEGIELSVSDGQSSGHLPQFSITVMQDQSVTGSTTLTWTPPTANDNGSLLSDLVAYKIYYGTSQGEYPNVIRVDNPGISSYVVDNLSPDTYYFVTTSINSREIESRFSNVATKIVN